MKKLQLAKGIFKKYQFYATSKECMALKPTCLLQFLHFTIFDRRYTKRHSTALSKTQKSTSRSCSVGVCQYLSVLKRTSRHRLIFFQAVKSNVNHSSDTQEDKNCPPDGSLCGFTEMAAGHQRWFIFTMLVGHSSDKCLGY